MHEQPSAMQTLRQLYVYAVTAVTLGLIALAAVNLLGLGLDRLFTAISGEGWIQDGPDWERERLSLYLPFIVIATPIWWLHWRMAQRAARGDTAVTERRSPVRNLFFALVFIVTGLQLALGSLMSLIDIGIAGALGARLQDFERHSIVTSLATLIVCAAIWVFHLHAYLVDVREETAEARATLPVPAVFFIGGAIGLVMAIFGARDLIQLGVDTMVDDTRSGRWWREPLAMGTATLVTGAALWTLHWPLTERLRRASTWWGQGRAGTTLRRGYLVSIAAITALLAILFLAEGINGTVRWATDIPPGFDESHASRIATPLLATLPAVGLWLLHRRRLLAEPVVPGISIAPVTVARLLGYAMAFVGLALATTGTAMLVSEAIQQLAGEDGWKRDAGWPLGLLIGGGGLWAWYWWQTCRRLTRDPEAEQSSTSRRAYLLLALAGAIVALVVGLAMTGYQVLQRVLDVSDDGHLASDIALPLGITVVTAAVAACHGLLLRRDLAVRALGGRAEGATRMELVLTGPAGADLGDVVRTLRRELPDGYAIAARPLPDASSPAPPDTGPEPTGHASPASPAAN